MFLKPQNLFSSHPIPEYEPVKLFSIRQKIKPHQYKSGYAYLLTGTLSSSLLFFVAGFVYYSQLVQNVPPDLRRKVSRIVGNMEFKNFTQYCGLGSRSAWIRVDLALPEPHPYWECQPGSRRKEIHQIQQIFVISSLLKAIKPK